MRHSNASLIRRSRRFRRLQVERLEDRLALAAIAWDGGPAGSGTLWHDPVNWVGDSLPGPLDDATIGAAFSGVTIVANQDVTAGSLSSAAPIQISGGTISIASASAVNGLLFGGGHLTGSGDLTVTGSFQWTAGRMSGTGKTVVNVAGGVISGVADLLLSRRLDNQGNLTYEGHRLRLANDSSAPGILTNLAGATFHASGPAFISYFADSPGNDGAFINQGRLVRSGTELFQISGGRFENAGTVEVQEGMLSLEREAIHTGDFQMAPGTTLRLFGGGTFATGAELLGDGYHLEILGDTTIAGGLHNPSGTITVLNPSDLAVAGTVLIGSMTVNTHNPALSLIGVVTIDGVFSAGELNIASGIVFLNGPSNVAALSLSGGSSFLRGSGDVMISDSLLWSAGSIEGTGQLTIGPDAVGTISGTDFGFLRKSLGRRLDNFGTLSAIDSPFAFAHGTVLTNHAGAIFTTSVVGTFPRDANTTFINEGTLMRQGPGATGFSLRFDNSGTIQVLEGKLSLSGVAGQHSGDIFLADGTTLELGGNLNFSPGADIIGTNYDLEMFGGNPLAFRGSINTSGSVRVFGGGDVQIAGSLTADSLIIGGGTSTAILDGDANVRVLEINGGNLAGTGNVTVTESFLWSGGVQAPDFSTMTGSGRTVLVSGVTGQITGDLEKRLTRRLDNQGTLTFDALRRLVVPTPGVLTNLPGGTFVASGDSDISISSHSFINQGTFRRLGPGDTHFVNLGFDNSGLVEIDEGLLWLRGGGDIQGQFSIATGAELRLSGAQDLSGAAISGPGTLAFDDAGSAALPVLWEAASHDVGNVAAGFSRNLALGSVTITDSVVRLVDAANNSPLGTTPEAVYAGILLVDSGSSLDLAGLHLYTRQSQIDGTIAGGTIDPLADGGVIPWNTPTPGAIGESGEADEWSFFARAGQQVSVELIAGLGNPLAPLPPALEFAEVTLLDPNGQVLASGASSDAQTVVELSEVALDTDGLYRIQVRAPASHAENIGNYVVTLWNDLIDIEPLLFHQVASGAIESPRSVDQWTFAALAGQQVQFVSIRASSDLLRFRLLGPDGFVGFADLSGDSALVALPTTGTYVLEAYAIADGGGDYTFELTLADQTELLPGTPYEGTLTAGGTSQLFRIEVAESTPLRLAFQDESAANQVELFLRRSQPPTRRQFDHRSQESGPNQSIFVPLATPGTWYLLLAANSVPAPSDFELLAVTSPVLIRSVSPDRFPAGSQTLSLTIRGAGFSPGAQVELLTAGGLAIAAQAAHVDGFDRITAEVEAAALLAGRYSIRITLPGGPSDTLPDALELAAAGEPQLTTRLLTPSDVGRQSLATFYVEYSNTGSAPMPAPLLTLQSADPLGRDRPLLTLDEAELRRGFWTSADPDGFANSVQIYASGATAGLLLPGESRRVPVYYIGLEQPWDLSDVVAVELELLVHEAGDSTPIDWNALRDPLRPEWMAEDVWEIVFANLSSQIGATWGDYVETLGENAVYLGRLGIDVTDVNELYAFEVQQAIGLSPLSVLQSVVDIAVAAPGLPLTFGRSFGGSLLDRYEISAMGRGWTPAWQAFLELQADGTIVLHESAGVQRRFQPDTRRSGTYFSQTGDTGSLRAIGEGYELTEPSGLVTRFNNQGILSHVEDPLGNRITAGYTAGLLTSLAHSAGQSLTLDYNAAGRLASVLGSDGKEVRYLYDPGHEHLVAVQAHDGLFTRYEYASGAGPAKSHALVSVQSPGGIRQFFSYDVQGRLASTFRSGNAEQVNFDYGSEGQIVVTDASGQASSLDFDHRGLLSRITDPLGHATQFTFDDRFQLVQVDDALGQSQRFGYDIRGNVINSTDELGNRTRFRYDGPFDRLTSFTDANGQTTGYSYDADGNLLATIYPDGSAERLAYDPLGNPVSSTNRRGQPIGYDYNAAGQVTRQTLPDGSEVEFTYDARGNLLTATDDSGVTEFEYDDGDRLTRVEYPSGRYLEFEYDLDGRRTRMVDHEGFTVNYAYDEAGRLARLTNGAGESIVEYTYDAAGRLLRKDQGNGTFTTYEYDPAGQLLHLVNHAPSGAVNSRFDYVYDSLGRRTEMGTLDGTWTYGYDATGQLVRAVLASTNPLIPSQDLTYVYDALGNRIRTIENGATTEYTTNQLNQYTAVGQSALFYDVDGNLISRLGGGHDVSYSYDAQNRLVSVVTPEGTWQYEYDAFGNRIATVHNGERTEYLLDPTGMVNVVGEYSAGGNQFLRYLHGNGLEGRTDHLGATAHFDFDSLGSTIGMTDASGQYVNRYGYLPFGQTLFRTETLENSFTFAGQFGIIEESNGLKSMRARFYDEALGKFLTTDPMGIASGNLNLLAYVENDPVNSFDPTGKVPSPLIPILRLLILGASKKRVRDVIAGVIAGTIADKVLPAEIAKDGISDAGQRLESNEERARDQVDHMNELLELERNNPTPNSPRVSPIEAGPISSPRAPDGEVSATARPWIRRPKDPNDKLGPAGFGDAAYVPIESDLPYRIRFENLGPGSVPPPAAPATAPAQRVEITDQLSPDLDWSTLQFTEFGFGDDVGLVPAGSQYHFASLPATFNGQSFDVEVELSFDSTSGLLRSVFQSLDPQTLLPPDVLTGFLPPEDGTGRGQGFISFSVRPKSGLPSGTEIRNIAHIEFDGLGFIATNQVNPDDPSQGTNPLKEAHVTMDVGAPASQIAPLPAVIYLPAFDVSWSAADEPNGSEVSGTAVYLSIDGGPFQLWNEGAAAESRPFGLPRHHRYALYSVATDNVGHSEGTPPTADVEFWFVGPPWQNPIDPLDTSDNGVVSVFDAVLVVNELNRRANLGADGELIVPPDAPGPQRPYIDPSGNNFVSAFDALLIVNELNRRLSAATAPGPLPEAELANGLAANSATAQTADLAILDWVAAHGSRQADIGHGAGRPLPLPLHSHSRQETFRRSVNPTLPATTTVELPLHSPGDDATKEVSDDPWEVDFSRWRRRRVS